MRKLVVKCRSCSKNSDYPVDWIFFRHKERTGFVYFCPKCAKKMTKKGIITYKESEPNDQKIKDLLIEHTFASEWKDE